MICTADLPCWVQMVVGAEDYVLKCFVGIIAVGHDKVVSDTCSGFLRARDPW